MTCIAIVTASHNDNGWTGVNTGVNRPLTFGPDEMERLEEIVLGVRFDMRGGGSYVFVERFPPATSPISPIGRSARSSRLRSAQHLVAQGVQHLHVLGWDCISGSCGRSRNRAESVGFDGHGDRTGVVDNEGREIFADKVGVVLVRNISARHRGATFVADVKSPGLFCSTSTARSNSMLFELIMYVLIASYVAIVVLGHVLLITAIIQCWRDDQMADEGKEQGGRNGVPSTSE